MDIKPDVAISINLFKKQLEWLMRYKHPFSSTEGYARIRRIVVQILFFSACFSHEPSKYYRSLCNNEEILYLSNKCIHFIPASYEAPDNWNQLDTYCVPYKTLVLRIHRIGYCPDGEYKLKEVE